MGEALRHLESAEQKALIQWARMTRLRGVLVSDFLISNNNAQKTSSAWAGRRLNDEGRKAGVSDLFLALPANGACGLWIELKAPATKTTKAGKPSPAQIEWLERMSQVGYAARLCYGWEAAKVTIQEYLA